MPMQHMRRARRRLLQGVTALAGTAVGWPGISLAQNKPIRIGMSTVLTGRIAMMGRSSRAGAMQEAEKFNAAGGLNGRRIEIVVRDSKGQPQDAARNARELVTKEGCDILIDAEPSSGALAVHEVARELGVLCLHTVSEASSLTADPKLHVPTAFRCARMGIHDAIVGGAYAAKVSREKGLRQWMTCSPDYAYGRDITAEFLTYLRRFNKDVEVLGEFWPKFMQPDYSKELARIVLSKVQAVYSALWGGDLAAFIDQGNIFGFFNKLEFFSPNMADYTVLAATKYVPPNIHSGNRYLRGFPSTPANQGWADAYLARNREMPTNWSWANASAISFLVAALKATQSTDGKKLSEALRGMSIPSPFGSNGELTMRAQDHTLIGYATGWGGLTTTEPYMPSPVAGDWKLILELEAEWRKGKAWA